MLNPIQIEDITGPIKWDEHGQSGFLPCPGRESHSGETGPRDCRIHLDGIPNIFCLHSSCRPLLDTVNRDLRAALKATGWDPPTMTEAQKNAGVRRGDLKQTALRLASAAPFILEEFAFDFTGSPEPRDFLSHMFEEGDTIWRGQPFMTGPGWGRAFTKLSGSHLPGSEFICPNPLGPEHNRTVANISEKKYFVVECDGLSEDKETNKKLCGAVIHWLRKTQGLTLRAVVDSGNKSLHGWFEYPGDAKYEWCVKVLPAIGVDPATLRLAQPVRLPNVLRSNGNLQTLLWMKGCE